MYAMDHEFDRAMLSCLSWSLYQPASTARRTVDNSDDPNPFKRLTYVPLSADDRGRTVLTGEITALLGGEYEVAVSIGARGQPTSLGGVLDAIDAALSGRATLGVKVVSVIVRPRLPENPRLSILFQIGRLLGIRF